MMDALKVERVQAWMANADSIPEWDDAFVTQNWLRLSPAEPMCSSSSSAARSHSWSTS